MVHVGEREEPSEAWPSPGMSHLALVRGAVQARHLPPVADHEPLAPTLHAKHPGIHACDRVRETAEKVVDKGQHFGCRRIKWSFGWKIRGPRPCATDAPPAVQLFTRMAVKRLPAPRRPNVPRAASARPPPPLPFFILTPWNKELPKATGPPPKPQDSFFARQAGAGAYAGLAQTATRRVPMTPPIVPEPDAHCPLAIGTQAAPALQRAASACSSLPAGVRASKWYLVFGYLSKRKESAFPRR